MQVLHFREILLALKMDAREDPSAVRLSWRISPAETLPARWTMEPTLFDDCVEVTELWFRVDDDHNVLLLGREPHVAVKMPRTVWVAAVDYVARMFAHNPMAKPPVRLTY
jgi:hypothetical protein